MDKVLIIYATRTGETENIAQLIGERIFETMKNVFNMDMVSGPLRLKSSILGGGRQMAQDYGREVGKRVIEKQQGS